MNNKIKNIAFVFVMLLANVAFSQPDPDGAGGATDPTDTAASIDSNLILLAVAGMAICYYQF